MKLFTFIKIAAANAGTWGLFITAKQFIAEYKEIAESAKPFLEDGALLGSMALSAFSIIFMFRKKGKKS